ncbi:MAG: glycosyltransferase [Candidatus Marinimicrobia bacterium]|nr:glycosyltransferase [Candidatus Neomarinimicrobiota bacterium]
MWFSILFLAAEVHGYLALLLFLLDMWAPVRPAPPRVAEGLSVDVFIPTYNEDVGLLRRTVLGAKNIRYPHRTYVLDDGDRADIKAMAEELGVEVIARPEHHHAKAGNINHALRQTHGDFVAIFDADHAPQPDFLDRTLGFFEDSKMAFVQTPQFFYNLNAFEEFSNATTDEHWEQQSMFFHYLQPGKQRWNSAFFCGTCAVIRRQALEEVGGIATETITEDIHTSLLLHARGWKSIYLDEHLATGLAPSDVVSYFKQRLRWALGNLRVMFICNPLTLRGLKFTQRLSYFSSMFSWTIGFQKIIYFLTPPLMLLTPLMPIDRFFTKLVGLYFANLFLQLFTYKVLTGGRGRIFADELFNMLNFWFLIRSFFRAMFGLGQKFVVTSKSGSAERIPLRVVAPQLAIMLLCVVALSWWGFKLVGGINLDVFSSSIAAFWTVYVLILAWLAIARALRKYDVRSDYRFAESLPVWYRDEVDGPWKAACTADFNTQGLSLLTYEPLPMDRDITARLMTELGPVETVVRILYRRPKSERLDVYAYGGRFINLEAEAMGRLNTQALQRTVPQLIRRIYPGGGNWRDLLRGFLPYRATRRPVWSGLPVSVNLDAPGEWRHGWIESLAGRELVVATQAACHPGATGPFLLLSPFGIIRGEWRVEAPDPAPPAGGVPHCRFFLERLTAESAAHLDQLLEAKR